MNLVEIRQKLKTYADFSTLANVIVDQAINWAYLQIIENNLQWSWRKGLEEVTLPSGDSILDIAAEIADFEKIRWIQVPGSENEQVERMDEQIYRNLGELDTGEPEYYCPDIEAGKLYFDKEADSNYTLKVAYIKDIEPLSADSDIPVFKTRYHELLLFGAMGFLWDYPEESPAKAANYLKLFYSQIDIMARNAKTQTDVKTGTRDVVQEANNYRDNY